MRPIRKPGQLRLTGILLIAFFTVLGVIVLTPFVSMVLTSIKPSNMVIRNGFNLKFENLTLENYKYLFTGDNQYFRWFGNSLFLTLIQTVRLFLSAHGLDMVLPFMISKERTHYLSVFLIVMMIPFEILMLPLYREIVATEIDQ